MCLFDIDNGPLRCSIFSILSPSTVNPNASHRPFQSSFCFSPSLARYRWSAELRMPCNKDSQNAYINTGYPVEISIASYTQLECCEVVYRLWKMRIMLQSHHYCNTMAVNRYNNNIKWIWYIFRTSWSLESTGMNHKIKQLCDFVRHEQGHTYLTAEINYTSLLKHYRLVAPTPVRS